MFKSRSDSHFQTNRLGLTQRNLPEYWANLVRITHIMLKKRFYLTTQTACDILAMVIRIEDSKSRASERMHRDTQRYTETHRCECKCECPCA